MADRRVILALTMALAARAPATAQATQAHSPADTVTTLQGVFTFEQANRGKDIYAGNCRSCHTPETHTGPVFTTIWNGRSVADLYSFVRERMPKNDPGALTEQEYVDVVAYMLKMNKLPMGETELQADSLMLARVRIEIKP